MVPNCQDVTFTVGLVEEAMENLKDAVHLYLDVILEEEVLKKSLELA